MVGPVSLTKNKNETTSQLFMVPLVPYMAATETTVVTFHINKLSFTGDGTYSGWAGQFDQK